MEDKKIEVPWMNLCRGCQEIHSTWNEWQHCYKLKSEHEYVPTVYFCGLPPLQISASVKNWMYWELRRRVFTNVVDGGLLQVITDAVCVLLFYPA